MDSAARLRPRREVVVPAVTIASPALWFLGRRAVSGFPPVVPPVPQLAGLVAAGVAALLVGYVVASLFVLGRASDRSPSGPVRRAVFAPSDTGLAVFLAATVGLPGWLAISAVTFLPPFVRTGARLLGGLVGLPLVVLYGGLIVLANLLAGGLHPPVWVEWLVVAVGVATSVVWTAVLADVGTRRVTIVGFVRHLNGR